MKSKALLIGGSVAAIATAAFAQSNEPIVQPTETIGRAAPEAAPRPYDIVPFIEGEIIATDNIDLAPDDQKEEGVVGRFIAGAFGFYNTARLEAIGRANVEGRYDIIGEEDPDVDFEASLQGRYHLLQNRLFVDALATYEQVLTDNDSDISLNPGSSAEDTETVTAYEVSPNYRFSLGALFDGLASATWGQLFSDDDALANSNRYGASVQMQTRRSLGRWGLGASTLYEKNDSDDDVNDLERATLELIGTYNVNRRLDLLLRTGYDHIDSPSFNDNPDGAFASAGFRYRPSRRSFVSVLGGWRYDDFDLEANAGVYLSRRLLIGASYGRDVRTDADSFFDIASNRFTNSVARFEDDITRVPDLVPDTAATISDVDPFNPLAGSASSNDLRQNSIRDRRNTLVGGLIGRDLVGISRDNQAFQSDDATIFVQYQMPNDLFELAANYNQRDFDVVTLGDPSQDDQTLSVTAAWLHRFSQRLEGELAALARFTRSDDPLESDTDLYGVEANLFYRITPKATASLSLFHSDRTATVAADEYTENGAAVGLQLEF